MAAKKLGMEKVPCIRLDHLTAKQRREYAIAHNRTAEMSEWDFEILAQELDDLDFDGFDLQLGIPEESEFDEAALSDLFEDAPEKEKKPKKIQCPHCGEWFET